MKKFSALLTVPLIPQTGKLVCPEMIEPRFPVSDE